MNIYQSKNQTNLIVLKKGEELVEQLNMLAIEQNLKGGWINVIGGSSNVTLGYYDPEAKEYVWRAFDEPLEIIGLQGNLAWIDGEPFWHIHGTFSRRDYTTVAGHVKDCMIGLTGEVFLTEHDEQLTRVFDEDTGLKLLPSEARA